MDPPLAQLHIKLEDSRFTRSKKNDERPKIKNSGDLGRLE